jgi:tetratricopeptide (TPR) repeat protein
MKTGEVLPSSIPVFLLLLGVILLVFFPLRNSLPGSSTISPSEEQEILYLPKKEALQLLSFGYKQALADVLWMSTVNYFGKHFQSDKKYTWLAHRCELVLTLDPRSLAPVRFCTSMLSWEAEEPEKSEALLSQALLHQQDSWELYSLRGFTRLLFLKKHQEAGEDFRRAAKIPGAPVLVKRLATRDLATENPDDAIAFIQAMLRTATNEQEKKALQERLKEAVFLSLSSKIKRASEYYFSLHGRYPKDLNELQALGIIHFEKLEDPFGGLLELDKKTGELRSSKWKKKRIGENEKMIQERIEKWKKHDGVMP